MGDKNRKTTFTTANFIHFCTRKTVSMVKSDFCDARNSCTKRLYDVSSIHLSYNKMTYLARVNLRLLKCSMSSKFSLLCFFIFVMDNKLFFSSNILNCRLYIENSKVAETFRIQFPFLHSPCIFVFFQTPFCSTVSIFMLSLNSHKGMGSPKYIRTV